MLSVSRGWALSLSLAWAAAAATPYGSLNGYWGQYGSDRLSTYCDSGIKSVTLAFVNVAPEHDPSGYPGDNFAGHCWAGYYTNSKGVQSKLLSQCPYIQQDIPYCKSKGVKVLLSIGGEYTSTSNYSVSTTQNGVNFANFLYNAFGPYNSSWTGPRPFDVSSTNHTAVDGFDFDIEAKLNNAPYIAMINRFRTLNPSLFISAAPQCPTSDQYFYMKDLVNQTQLDALFVQFYNNPSCDAVTNTAGKSFDGFNYYTWSSILTNSQKSKNAKLYVGLPASTSAATNGYISPATLKSLICTYKSSTRFGGISLWDLTRGASNVDSSGKNYYQNALSYLQGGC